MLKEYHYDHLIRWPNGERACVFLTFDFQGGEDVKPDKNGILNYEMWSQGEYGPHHAIYRLLRILKEENVKATFLTCGAIAERFPEAVQAILDHGHVVEGHGYNHEIARYLPRDEEDKVMKKAIAMIQQRTGRRPLWLALVHAEHQHHRAPDRERLHLQHQLLPRGAAVPLGEERQGHGRAAAAAVRRRHAVRPPPRRIRQPASRARDLEGLFRRALFGEQRRSARNTSRSRCIPTSSDGRAARSRCAASSSTWKKAGGNLWFPTGIDLAEYCLNNLFKAEIQKLRASAG